MITKTKSFKVILDNPWVLAGTYHTEVDLANYIGKDENLEKYPHIFSRVYKLEDGSLKCLGQQIWRSKNYEVKSTTFNKVHIEQNTPIFGTRENCEKWLETNAKNIKAELLKQNSDSSFQTLKALVDRLEALDTLTPRDLVTIREAMKNCINNIETP